MIYVADTHSLIWFLTNSKKLSIKAKEIFLKAERGETIIIIPTISLMELLYICKKKEITHEFKDILSKLKRGLNYMVWDLNLEVVLKCTDLKKVVEMHDRIIVATAKIIKGKIITKDHNIEEANYVETVW